MTTTKSASKKTTRRIARKLNSAFTRKASRAMSRRKQLEMKAALERHSRKCIICHHPEREAIEEEFLHWRAPWKLAEDYNLADYRTIYRHARAAGLLLQRRENLHSGLDAFVEAVDDVKFTGDTILRAMRAYSCIDRHGRWTEIPTQVHISTFRDPGPAPSPSSYRENDSDIIDIEPEQLEEDLEEDEEEYDDPEDDPDDGDSDTEPEYPNRASRRDATACASSPAQAFSVTDGDSDDDEEEYDEEDSEPDDPDDDPDADPDDDDRLEGNDESKLDEPSLCDATACAAPPAQDSEPAALPQAAPQPTPGRCATATACAASPAQQSVRQPQQSTQPAPQAESRQSPPQSPIGRRATATACAVSPAQPTPRNAVRGHNPQSCSVSEHTARAASPAQPAPHAHAWQNPLPPPAPLTDYPPVYPIYGPAIKNERKTQCFSKLRFSNRR